MEWYLYLAVIVVGIIAGIINTLAGGGSLLTLPLLMFLGLPANVANGTNRIAILFGALTPSVTFVKRKVFDIKQGLLFGIPTIIGALAGSQIAVSIENDIMEKIIGGVLILMIPFIVLKPKAWLESKNFVLNKRYVIINIVVFFLVGVYGGFIQAGVGYFLLISLVFSAGFDLFKANALKIFLVLLYTPVTIIIFFLNGQIVFLIGIILAIGNMVGAYIGTKIAIKKGASFIRYFLIVSLLASSLKLLGLF